MNTPESINDPTQNPTPDSSRLQGSEPPTSRREEGQRRTGYEGCHAARVGCKSRGSTCLRCLLLGLDCVRPFEDQQTLSTELEVTVKPEDGLPGDAIIPMAEDGLLGNDTPMTEDGSLGNETLKTEGGPTLWISQAQDTLDNTPTEPNRVCNDIAGNSVTSAQDHALQHQCSAGGRHNGRCLQIDSVTVLSWPVFAGQFEPQANAMAVLPQKHPEPRQPPDSSSESCLMLLVWALGAIAMPFPESRWYYSIKFPELGPALFGMASKRLGVVFAEGGILPAQCFFFAGVYLLYMLQPASAWRHFLQALAYCQELDVAIQGARKTQVPTPAPNSPPAELNLWWSCWKAEMDLRLSLGIFDFQTQGPAYTESLPDIPVNPYVDSTVRLFYSAEIALLKLTFRARNDIGQILSSFSGGNDANLEARLINAVIWYDEQARVWLASLPKPIALKMQSPESDIYCFTLSCRILDFKELIFWKFLEHAINSGKERLPQCVYAYAGRGILVCLNRILLAMKAGKHRHEGTWMLLQSCARSVIVIVAASLSHHAQSLLPKDWICFVDSGIHVLRYWVEESAGIRSQVRALEDLRQVEEIRKKLGC
ncbi:hypothetical protein CCMA1212_001574 [Trichoderma ghanense]|uniref:Transcription factor domain-containing protein n=1 Tax=Trichoderma ghanense TaxID=65468 RepID=A0ABY2HDN2_9HYPO